VNRSQWAAFGWCVDCTSAPGEPCRYVLFKDETRVGLGGEMPVPHDRRGVSIVPADATSMLDDIVSLSVRESVVVRPGDTLVMLLAPDQMLADDPSADLNIIREFMLTKLPRGCHVVIVAAPGQMGVIRGTAETREAAGSAPGGGDASGGTAAGGVQGDAAGGTASTDPIG
jgi:hypothetical protein